MTFKDNPIVEFCSSIRFGVLIISLLVATSIVGTILPQGQPLGFYMEKYGAANAIIMEILGLANAYTSMWFQFLLFILCLNLVVCSIDRIPQVFKFINKDNLSADLAKLRRNKDKILLAAKSDRQTVEIAVQAELGRRNWKIRSRAHADYLLLFSEKCAWSRLGAYLVHLSILVIVLGAVIGSTFGFKAFVMVPEGGTIDTITDQNKQQSQIPLPFTLRCDGFEIENYPNGMPKEYRSDLVVLEGSKEVAQKRITVNDPFNYSGLTFFQSSYEPLANQYAVELTRLPAAHDKAQQTGINEKFYVKAKTKNAGKDNQVRFEIVATSSDGHGHGPYKIWFDDNSGDPVNFIAEDKQPVKIERGGTAYSFTIKQRFATGLQVAKDPGVWIVYAGFALMLFGMYAAFFLAHRRLWLAIQESGTDVTVILCGSSNKNQAGLTRTLDEIAHGLLTEKTLEFRRI